MIQIYLASNLIDAQVLKDYLCGAGVEAVIKGEYLMGAIGELPTNAYPSVWIVDPGQEEKAREMVHNYESNRRRDQLYSDEWFCPGCGERSEAQFTQCWKCGRQRL